jgi:hypothetical protein
MAGQQFDLFGTGGATAPKRGREAPSEEVVRLVRARLQATLALVRGAERMPWEDHLAIIREDNAFRFGVEALPEAEGAAMWAEFDRHMDRLYAVMNAEIAARLDAEGQ